MKCSLLLLSLAFQFALPISAFTAPTSSTLSALHRNKNHQNINQLQLQSQSSSKDEECVEDKVAVGSSEYYQGVVSRSLNEEPVQRVTGDNILGPTFKFVGGFAVILVVLTFGFLASNGII
jgi:hypothetical protein